MPLDSATLQQAHDAGYSDDEIYDHLAKTDPKFAEAKQNGYALADVAKHFDPQPGTEPSPTPTGQIEAGNIDLKKRPVVKNPDGSISTVRSISSNIDGREVLLPTVSEDGRIMNNAEAIQKFKDTGKHLGIFDTPANVTAYADQLHQDQANLYGPQVPRGTSTSDKALILPRSGTQTDVEEMRQYAADPLAIPAIPQQEGKVAQVAAGAANIPIGMANFMLSPAGPPTLALGAAPATLSRLVATIFGAQSAAQGILGKTTQEKVTGFGGAALGAAGAVKLPSLVEALKPIFGEAKTEPAPVEAPIINAAGVPLPEPLPPVEAPVLPEPAPVAAPIIPTPTEALPTAETPTGEQLNAVPIESAATLGTQPFREESLGGQGSAGVGPSEQGPKTSGKSAPAAAEAQPVTPGTLWYQGVGPEGQPTSWVTSNLEKAKIYAKRRGNGKINVFTPEQVGETAFADQEGNLLPPVEYAKTQSTDTTIQTLGSGGKLPDPIKILDHNGNDLSGGVERSADHREPTDSVSKNTPPDITSTKNAVIEAEPQGPTGIKNTIIDQNRVKMGLPERMKPARATNQVAWDAAMAKIDQNSSAGSQLVEDLVAKPRALDPVDTGVLLHEKLTRENNFDNAVEAVNNSKTEAERTQARTALQIARDAFQEIADVSQNQAGRESGLSLQARKMLVNRDFSLARMEAEERASANGGKPLSESQLSDVKAAHEKIKGLEGRLRELESEQQNAELRRYFDKLLAATKKSAKETAKRGNKLVDFLHDQRDQAREREKARGGRLSAGIDPAQLADQIIIGASHIADGLVVVGEWSAKMTEEFGEKITPFLQGIFDHAKLYHASTAAQFAKDPTALKRYKTLIQNKTVELQRKTAVGDFSKPVRNKTQLDAEAEKLKGAFEREKDKWLTRQAANDAANRTRSQKFWDGFVGIERAMKLSSDVVLAKLTLAAAAREGVLTPVEEVAGGVVSKVLPGLAKRAPREGGFSLDAEVKAKVQMFTKGMQDSWQNLKMQKSDLEAIHGKKEYTPQEWYQYFGYLHGALKAPVKRAEFARSMAKRIKWAAEDGKDINNPNVIGEMSQEAYVDANRSIFMQDNVASNVFSGAMRMAERNKIAPNLGPGFARLGRFLIPIVKVPTNIVGEVATGVHGVATGSVRAGAAYWRGIKSLPTEQGDAIMRQLKKGLVGNSLLLAGYFGYKSIGGFYHQGDQRTEGDVAAGRFRVGDSDLPAYTQHSTGAMLMNIGATVHRVQDERIKKSEPATKGLAIGAVAAGQGLVRELPFVPALTGAADAIGTQHGFERYINGLIMSTTTPAVVSHVAKVIDTPGSFPSNILNESTKRAPKTKLQAVEMGIPILRGNVPEKSARANKANQLAPLK